MQPWRPLPWEIHWSREARSDLDRAPAVMQRRVVVALERYARSGYGDVVRLAGTDQLRLRVGDWRVRFRHSIVVQRVIAGDEAGADHEREVRLIEVIVIRPRGSAYRD